MPYIGPAPEPSPDGIKDLNGGKLVLDADADTSITADTDDQIDIEIAGSDEIKITSSMVAPATADGSALGGTSNEWSDVYLADGGVIYLGSDQEIALTHNHNVGLKMTSTAYAPLARRGEDVFIVLDQTAAGGTDAGDNVIMNASDGSSTDDGDDIIGEDEVFLHSGMQRNVIEIRDSGGSLLNSVAGFAPGAI